MGRYFARVVSELSGFKFKSVRVTPNLQRPLAAELCVGGELVCKLQNDTNLLYQRRKFSVARTSQAARGKKFDVFCLFVRHAFE